jgi:hypothetical protein
MRIELAGGFVLVSDEYQIILQERKKNLSGKDIGVEYFNNVGYYGTLEHALMGYVRKCMLKSKATTVSELLAEIKGLRKYIEEVTK